MTASGWTTQNWQRILIPPSVHCYLQYKLQVSGGSQVTFLPLWPSQNSHSDTLFENGGAIILVVCPHCVYHSTALPDCEVQHRAQRVFMAFDHSVYYPHQDGDITVVFLGPCLGESLLNGKLMWPYLYPLFCLFTLTVHYSTMFLMCNNNHESI